MKINRVYHFWIWQPLFLMISFLEKWFPHSFIFSLNHLIFYISPQILLLTFLYFLSSLYQPIYLLLLYTLLDTLVFSSYSLFNIVRYSLYQREKVYRVYSELYEVQKPVQRVAVLQTFLNNLGFSLLTLEFSVKNTWKLEWCYYYIVKQLFISNKISV